MDGETKFLLIIAVVGMLSVLTGVMYSSYSERVLQVEAIKAGLVQKCENNNGAISIIWVRPEEKPSVEKK